MWLGFLLLSSVFMAACFTVATSIVNHDQLVLHDTYQSFTGYVPTSHQGVKVSTEKVLFYDLDDIQYFTPYHQSSCTLRTATTLPIGETFTPIVVIPVSKPDEGIFTPQHLRPLIESYLQQDDVLTQSFFNTVLLHPEDRSTKFDIDISALVYLMREMDAKILILDESLKINLPSPGTVLPSLSVHTVPSGCLSDKTAGPYLARSQLFGNEIDLFPVYRLYAEYYRTFVSGVYPLNDGLGTYRVLGKVDEFGNQMIPVPSRLYTIDSEKPLAGERVGVKDIYYIKGLPTTAGSRTYTAWRGTANTTASSMVKLQNEGAEIVGKAKTVAYASSGMVIEKTYDQLYPFSPRGDLYQSCGSSSSGPACAMAAYHWLDFTVGSDTAGSVRGPAAVAGLYGNKPTQGIINLDGLVQVLKWTDTPGIFTRSPAKFKKILDAWYSDSQANRRHNHLPKTLLVPSDDFPDMPENIRSIVVKTLRVIENTLGMKVEMINQTATHPHKHPDDGGFMTVEMFKKRYLHGNRDISDRRSSSGTDPKMKGDSHRYVDPFPLDKLPVYREEKLNNISESFIPKRKNRLFAYAPASISGAPEYVVPIGHVPFKSLVSGVEEMHPLSMSFIAYPGCDSMLLGFVNKLGQLSVRSDVHLPWVADRVWKL